MKTVYVAGPLTKGDMLVNVHKACAWGNHLMDKGFAPYIPHLSSYLEIMQPRPYEIWMDIDFAFVRQCDIFFRLDGESPGADREEELARSLGKPIYYEKDFIKFLREQGR